MNGFDISEFNKLINQVEQLGADMDKVAEKVLDAGSDPAKRAFLKNMPKNSNKNKVHARDNVTVTKTKKSRRGSKFRLIGANSEKFKYLYYVDRGHVRAPAHPFLDRAFRDVRAAAYGPMEETLKKEIETHLK